VSVQAPTQTRRSVREAEVGGEKVARSRGFEWLARSGFVARGLIYGIIGILAIEVALGVGGTTTNQQGALKTIARQPFGKVLLILVAIGLAGYALWRLLHALLGHGPEDSDSGFERVAALGSGIVYAGLCAIAVETLVGSGSSGGSGNTSKTTAGIFGWPGGTWLVAIGGAVLIGVGLYQGYRGISKDFLKDSKTEQMSARVRNWIEWIGSFGHLARMVVFGLVGVFLIKAAIDYDPNNAVGLDGALAKLGHASYGPFLLGIVAAGLIAFGLYSLSDARYRRI
jgi:fumarate reductase subunit D